MALYYAEFDTTPANFLADLNTQMANATDWSRPNSGSRPNTWKATTTRGADMVVDFNGAAPTNVAVTIQPYLSYDGTTLGATGPTRYIRYSRNGGGSTSEPIHVVLSASKEHLYLTIEGPRGYESGADDSKFGSHRRQFGIFDLVPYFNSTIDPNPAVVVVGHSGNSQDDTSSSNWTKVYVSKSVTGKTWQPGALLTLTEPGNSATGQSVQRISADGNVYLAPYVYFDEVDGMRGRLNNIYNAGWNYQPFDYAVPPLSPDSFVTFNSVKYKLKAPYRSMTNGTALVGGPLGQWSNNSTGAPNIFFSPLVAVPTP